MDALAFFDRADQRLARRLLTAMVTLSITLVIYGSWLPLRFDIEKLNHADWTTLQLTLTPTTFQDATTNLLIYVAVGLFLAMRLQLTRWSLWIRVPLVLLAAVLTALLAELGQLFVPGRYASGTDLLCNGLGTLCGIGLAPVAATGLWRLVHQFKIVLVHRPMLALYWIALGLVLLAKLAPFDLAILPGQLEASLAAADWSPFSTPDQPPGAMLPRMVEMAGSFCAFALLGILGALAWRENHYRKVDSVVNAVAHLILLGALIELLQLLIVSHVCDATDWLIYVYGAVVGAVLGVVAVEREWLRREPHTRSTAGQVMLMVALVVQVSMIVAAALPPDGRWVQPTDDSFQWIPFYAQFRLSFATAVGTMVSSFLWYMALAVIAAVMIPVRRTATSSALTLLLTVGVVSLTELMHAFNLGHQADITQPILAIVAALVAVRAIIWVEHYRLVHAQTLATPIPEFKFVP
ncbi:MAG: hypothetical protein HJJLKODD_00711 [Phycisphaerae bacterium]|nr:hypothetical protein [Phycisphaerae bacterium]